MTEDGYTPGPWEIGDINTNPDDGVLGEVAIIAKTDRTPQGFCTPAVALPFGDHSPGRKMAMANARLIAAAPDLHENNERLRSALRKIVELAEGTYLGDEFAGLVRAGEIAATALSDKTSLT